MTLTDRLINAPPDFFLGCTFTIAMCIFALYQIRWMRKQREASDRRLRAKLGKLL